MPPSKLTWLHLSDLHFREGHEWQQDVVLNALTRDVIEELGNEGLAPDLVFVTGDIAHGGHPAEYVQAQRFFDKVAHMTGIDPTTSWFVVPGNHDVDRAKIAPLTRATLPGLGDGNAVEDILTHEASLRLFTERQTAFFDFTRQFLGTQRAWSPEQPWKVETTIVHNQRVAVLGLNTAWCAEGGESDRGRIMLGEYQARCALLEAEAYPDAVRIALMHHPFDWFREFDQDRVEALLKGAGGVNFLLRGHLHKGRLSKEVSPDSQCIEFAAGACWEHSTFPHGINLVCLEPEAAQGTIHLWRYSPEGRGFWKRDNFLYENLDKGTWKFTWAAPRILRVAKHSQNPLPEAAGAIEVQTIWDRDCYRSGVDACKLIVRFSLHEKSDSRPQDLRVRVHHLLALDISGSMDASDKLPVLQAAIEDYLDILDPDDLVTVIFFSTKTEAIFRAETVEKVRQEGAARLKLGAWAHKFGSTYMNDALRALMAAIQETRAAGFVGAERVCCLTDGHLHDFFDCQMTLREFQPLEVDVVVFGFGGDFSSSSAEQLLAGQPRASVRYAMAGGSELREYFGHLARTSQRIVLTDAEVIIDVPEDVSCFNVFWLRPHERLVGNYQDERAPSIRVPVGSMERHKRYIMLLELRPWKAVSSLGKIRIRAKSVRGVVEAQKLFVPPCGDRAGKLDSLVEDMFASVAFFVRKDRDTHLNALQARIKLYEAEGRPEQHVQAMKRQLEIVSRGGRLQDLSEDDRNIVHSSAGTSTSVPEVNARELHERVALFETLGNVPAEAIEIMKRQRDALLSLDHRDGDATTQVPLESSTESGQLEGSPRK